MEENNSVESGIDKSQFYDLFKEIQSQIKDKVISKHLYLLEQQAKELTELKKENALLKNQLTYILKRILLNKNDYTSAARTNRLNNLNSSINYNRSMILKDNNRKSNSMLRPLRSCENYRCVTENIGSRYKEANNSTINIHGNDSSNNNVDNKISGYLNSLYRHNFNNSNKPGGNQFLNKKEGLLEELFPNKNSSFYMNTENEQLAGNDGKNKNRINIKRENNSSEKRSSYKKNNMRNNYGTKNNSTSKRYKSKYLDTNINTNKKRNKDNSYMENNEKNKYNTINNATRKNKVKKPVLYTKRSPFIANKF